MKYKFTHFMMLRHQSQRSLISFYNLFVQMLLRASFFILVILTFAGFIHYATRPDPLSKLDVPYKFRIYRDEHGIPKIVTKDYESSFFARGFAEAQDRLWTMFLKKKIIEGKLCEVFGKQTLPLDFQIRNYAFMEVGKMNAELLPEKTRKWLQAYVDGINSYAKIQNYLPLEFYLTWSEWEEWTIQNSLAHLAFMSFVLEFDWMYEIARQRLLETAGFDLAWKMMPFGEDNLFREVTIIEHEELKQMGKFRYYNASNIEEILKEHWIKKTMPIGSINVPDIDYQTLGSNAWAVSAQNSETGRPIIANDPHLGLMAPSYFYMLEIIILEEDSNEVKDQVFGVMVDGMPSISIGINKHFAWGSTASYVDNKDVFHEQVRDNNGTLQYLFKEQWIPFRVREQKFNVRGDQQIVQTYYHTHRGPVIQNVFMDLHIKYGYPVPNKYRQNHTLTLSSAIYFPDKDSVEGLLELGFTKTFEEFRKIGSKINCPNIDSVWIDKEGNWGYSPLGRIPIREIPEMGAFVKDGSVDLYDMKQFKSYYDFPHLLNPKKGYVYMANNKYAEDSLDDRSSIHQLSTGRSYRLSKIFEQKIKNKEKFSFQTMKQMQLDDRDEFLAEAFPLILKKLEENRSLWSNHETQLFFQKLMKWDYHMPITSVQTSIYHAFEHQFQEKLLHGTSLSVQQRQAIINHAFFEIYLFRLYEKIGNDQLTDEQAQACTNQHSSNYTSIHPCLANVVVAFKELPRILQEIFGTKNIEEYQWGKIHQHVFKSVPFSEIPVLKSLWERRVPTPGNSRTLNVGILTHQTKSYNSIAGPVFRFITDLNRTIFSFDLGETDNIFSENYDNFLGKNKYIEYTQRNPFKQQIPEWREDAVYKL